MRRKRWGFLSGGGARTWWVHACAPGQNTQSSAEALEGSRKRGAGDRESERQGTEAQTGRAAGEGQSVREAHWAESE